MKLFNPLYLVHSRTLTRRCSMVPEFQPDVPALPALPSAMPPMPQPGDRCEGFMAEAHHCWRMVYGRQLQATHCRETPSWTGRWFSPRGDRWWRVWACPEHLEGLTGMREFRGRAR